ncbi:MAG: DUF2219 family protein, partial [Gemmatimonadaceae bacterium]|nr:DUF2219 family protein [Gemmatimonadaceae bacterium]
MSVLRVVAAALWMTVALPAPALHAQAVPGTLVQGENDALDLWLPGKERPDGEYTNGLRISLSRSAAPLWGRLVGSASPCTGREAPTTRCLTTELAIAQQMYTPEPLSHRASELASARGPARPAFAAAQSASDSVISAPIPGDRPFAGWLHA